jgi:hypothetical protein
MITLLRQLSLALCLAAAVCQGATTAVETLTPDSATQGWGQLQINKSVGGQPLTIAGKTFEHGLGTHAASEIIYELDGEYTGFTAWVGVDDEMRGYTSSTVVFQIFGDGKKLFDSGVMRLNQSAKRVNVAVAGVDELDLIVTDAGDGSRGDHADWAEPVLTGTRAEGALTAKYSVKAPGLTINLNERGRIAGTSVAALKGWTRLGGCRQVGEVAAKKLAGGGYAFTRQLADAQNHSALVTDLFTPTKDSIRWEVEITSDDKPWSTAIRTEFRYPATPESRFWTTWGHPDNDPKQWADPLAWQPFADRTWGYQFLDYTQMGSMAKRKISIPMFIVAEPRQDAALTFMQSPEDTLLDLSLSETSTGNIRFQREKYRLGKGRTVRFHMDLAAHPADTRAGLGWVVARYPQFFNPGIARADELSGSCAYSGNENPIDVAAFKKMGFAYNWKLSDDFPYMGNFIPPVKSMDEKWTRSCAEPAPPGKGCETSCRQMNDYAKYMKQNGFAVLSYFNVTEYGKNMPWPIPPKQAKADADLWKNPADYLYHGGMERAVLMDGSRPFYSNCYGAVIVDPGETSYMNHIVEQVRRNNVMLPDVDGICIDRLDWLGHYNERGDDGVSWVNGKPGRSLFVSFERLADKIAPELHKSGKVLFLNNCTPRIEVIGRGDGIFAEWASDVWGLEVYVNYTALAAVRKPACLWTAPGEASDFYLQRCLYLGVYPIAPYPSNNHCLGPSAEGQNMVKNLYATGKDNQFIPTPAAAASPEGLSMAYGPLLTAMRGKKWVLAPHCVETATPNVKVNLFEVPGGYVLPVSFGGKAESATVQIRNIPGLEELKAVALHPGVDATAPVASRLKGGVLTLTVPLVRGCAMVKLSK